VSANLLVPRSPAVQDAAVAALVTRMAENQDAGRDLPLGEC